MNVLVFDFGASSVRAILGVLDQENRLNLNVLYRSPNEGVQIGDSLYWNMSKLWQDIMNSLKIYVNKFGPELISIAINTWGVDFVLLDENDKIIGQVYHYRDKRTDNILEELFKVIPKNEIFSQTGIQFMQINTLVQIYAMIHKKSPHLNIAKTFLMLPDYFNFLLSGKKSSEYSIATTSQLYNTKNDKWAFDLINRLNLGTDWFLETIKPGTILGNIKNEIANKVGLHHNTKIIVGACHDTASAIAAVPVDMNKYNPGEWAYLSSGTWSLMGVELDKPIINNKSLDYNFTNEGGINNTIRFLKNITGLWLIQECKKIWEKNGLKLKWDNIIQQADKAQNFRNFIDPNDETFTNPINMIKAIKNYCISHNQSPPEGIGQISRIIFESLAFKYKQVIENLEDLIGNKIKILYIIGGGSQNNLLNQFTANILNIPVIAGPIEATAIGNILIQALALKKVKNIPELRACVKSSFPINEFIPKNIVEWEETYKIYLEKIS